MLNKGMMSSNTDLWATPQEFFDKLNNEFGFDLDVCANAENAKCAKYFTKEQDGLSQNWRGHRCWMNPPYGREIGKWCKKALESNTLVVGLLPARTDTKYFHEYIYNKAEIRFVKGRIKFIGIEAISGCVDKNSAPFPSMVVIWNKNKS